LGLIDRGYHAAVSGAGELFLAGDFHGAIDFGGGPLATSSAPDTFLARLDPAGNPRYSRLLGRGGVRRIMALAVTAQGHCVILGQFRGILDLGGRPLRSRTREALFVARFDEFGEPLFSRSMDGEIMGRAIAVDSRQNVLITGYFGGTVDFGWGPCTSKGGEDAFLLKLDGAGNPIGLKQFGGPKAQRGYRLAVGPEDQIVLSGYFEGTADFGGEPLESPGGWNLFIARFSSTGEHLRSHRFAGASVMRGHGIGVDHEGHVILAGHLQRNSDLDRNPLHQGDGNAIFVAKLDPYGNPIYVKRFHGTAIEYRQGLAVDRNGCAVITGHVLDAAVLNGQHKDQNDWSLFVTKLDPSGIVLWSRRYRGTPLHFAQRLGVSGTCAIGLTGYFDGVVDFGGGPLASGEGSAVFVATLAP
jgi:hypothetical protein